MKLDCQQEYAGFWIRSAAAIIDTVILLMLILPMIYLIYSSYYLGSERSIDGGWETLFSWLFPFVLTVLFWTYRSATPGKMILKLKIVDAKTGEPLSITQSIIRYLGYYLSSIMCLGFIWIIFSRKKQGWHDMLAGNVVVRTENRDVPGVDLENKA